MTRAIAIVCFDFRQVVQTLVRCAFPVLLGVLGSMDLSGQPVRLNGSDSLDIHFILLDSRPYALRSMRQSNQNFVSAYSWFMTADLCEGRCRKYLDFGVALLDAVFLAPLTHEEGHRSILTVEGIGSISRPYPNAQLTYYVKGVTDVELQTLRDKKLPTFIRLHTAGLESDLAITNRLARMVFFSSLTYDHIKYDYLIRKMGILSYFLTGFWPALAPDIEEEQNELERDIVGHDIFGAVRHLHRPSDPFYRYTNFDDLTREERNFVRTCAGLSFLQLADPLLFGKEAFPLLGGRFNFNVGFGLTPFGGQLIESFHLKKGRYNLSLAFEQSFNARRTFWGIEVGFTSLKILDRLQMTTSAKLWSQPEDLAFHTSSSDISAAIKSELKFRSLDLGRGRYLGLALGGLYKGSGFLQEELNLDRGLTVWGGILYHCKF